MSVGSGVYVYVVSCGDAVGDVYDCVACGDAVHDYGVVVYSDAAVECDAV